MHGQHRSVDLTSTPSASLTFCVYILLLAYDLSILRRSSSSGMIFPSRLMTNCTAVLSKQRPAQIHSCCQFEATFYSLGRETKKLELHCIAFQSPAPPPTSPNTTPTATPTPRTGKVPPLTFLQPHSFIQKTAASPLLSHTFPGPNCGINI